MNGKAGGCHAPIPSHPCTQPEHPCTLRPTAGWVVSVEGTLPEGTLVWEDGGMKKPEAASLPQPRSDPATKIHSLILNGLFLARTFPGDPLHSQPHIRPMHFLFHLRLAKPLRPGKTVHSH